MPASFPTTVPLRTPLVRTLTIPTRVIPFLDGSEQRFSAGDPLNAFELTFTDVPAADITALETFIDTVKGARDSAWSFVGPDGVTYPHMGLEQDDLTAVENNATKWTCSVKMRQVLRDGAYSDTAAAVYPALYTGVYTQRPYTRARRWMTTRNDLASGPRAAWAERSAALRSWVCEYPVLTLAELASRISFFIAMRGKLNTFTMRDAQTGGDIVHCRLDMDGIVARCLGGGQWATSVMVTEFVG